MDMLKTYESILADFDKRQGAALIRYQLALACRRTVGDLPRAKLLLSKKVEEGICIDPSTGMTLQSP